MSNLDGNSVTPDCGQHPLTGERVRTSLTVPVRPDGGGPEDSRGRRLVGVSCLATGRAGCGLGY